MRVITLKRCKRIRFIYYSADGARLLVIVTPTKLVGVTAAVSVDIASGTEISRVEFPNPNCYNVDPLITRLVVGAHQGYMEGASPLRWIAVPHGTDWYELEAGGVGRICDVAFDRSGTLFAATSATNDPHRANPRCKVDVFRFPPNEVPKLLVSMPTARPAGAVVFSPDSKKLGAGAGLGGVNDFEVFDIEKAKRLFKFAPDVPERRAMIFLPDGRLVAAAGTKVYVLRNKSKPQFELGTTQALVNDVAVTADGRRIFAAMNNGTVQVWDANTGAAGPVFNWGIGGVWSLALAPDGLTCSAAGSKSRIALWDVDA
jgi:WD40 repeat protein